MEKSYNGEFKELKQVYRYWISKADGKIHKDIAYIKTIKADRIQGEKVIILDSQYRTLGDMSKFDFDNNMLKRTANQFVIFYKENDELALKHFVWAVKDKIRQAKEQVEHYEDALEKIENEAIREDC